VPTRPELRQFYGKTWHTVTRPRILARAGGRFDANGRYLGGARCEQCGVPDRTRVTRACGWWMITPELWWVTPWQAEQFSTVVWHAAGGVTRIGDVFPRQICREVYIVICICHLNHTSGDDRDENLKALCQYCHLALDVFQHKQTRCARKDRARPLLRA
jgi:hypothetical protein